MFFPGGDGGSLVWPTIQAAAAVLHKHHPGAEVWVSAQEFDAADLTKFFDTIATPAIRSFLHGVVVGEGMFFFPPPFFFLFFFCVFFWGFDWP